MSHLLDTNIVSEWTRPAPDPGVIAWLAELDEDSAFLSVITLTELQYGIELLSPGARSHRLAQWLQEDLVLRFDGRILPVDPHVANACARIVAGRRVAGRPISAFDAIIAATAQVHHLTLVTRNVGDFEGVVESLLNPWHKDDASEARLPGRLSSP